jgi:HD-GYP domain-containing protein (c-di-GMP phosphodiesterase class II)
VRISLHSHQFFIINLMMAPTKESEKHEVNDAHYLRAVTELGDTHKIVAACDIYSQSGIKLVAADFRITSALYDRLVKHKLLPTLDKALSIENMLDSEHILADALELIEKNDKLGIMAQIVSQGNSYTQIINNLRLPAPLLFKLTVAKEKFPRVYHHSLLMMVISVYLARCDKMNLQEEECVAIAALFIDIGLLHIDPKLLEPMYVMNSAERRHLYAHPLTAYLLLGEFPELPKRIANAVLEHHERMDGSGYPRGLKAEKISRYGQILAVTVLAAKAYDLDNPRVSWNKLDTIFKLNSKKFGRGLIGHLNIFREDAVDTISKVNEQDLLIERVTLIAKLFEDFNRYSDPLCVDPIFDFAQIRMVDLRMSMVEAGFDPHNPQVLIQTFIDDPESVAEYTPLLEETVWQFKSLLLEISRLWPEAIEKSKDEAEKPEHVWLSKMNLILLMAN